MIKLINILRETKVLSVFDFDDTIAKTDGWVYVMQQGRVVRKLDAAQLFKDKLRSGEEYNFEDFDKPLQNPRLIKKNAALLIKQLNKAKKEARGTRKVTILTARRLGAPVTQFLKSVGIDAYVVALGGGNPELKADWIEQQIKKGYDTIYFMDDHIKNVKAVENRMKKYPNVRLIAKVIR